MGKLIDWVCLNCFFIGGIGDRGIVCCESPNLKLADTYYNKRKEEATKMTKDRRKEAETLEGTLTMEIESQELYDKFKENEN